MNLNYFEKLIQEDPMVFDSFRNKIRYFHPGFHSTTPEGLNSRLTFLLQCTRQGNTNQEQGATNLAFGRAPICILRIGDFYHTKIVIDSIAFDYEPLVWDLNPEGIGVQPMIANVTMSFKFIGGSSLLGPINKLQNALSFNYFANTQVYDPRADYIARKPTVEVEKLTLGENETSETVMATSDSSYRLVNGSAFYTDSEGNVKSIWEGKTEVTGYEDFKETQESEAEESSSKSVDGENSVSGTTNTISKDVDVIKRINISSVKKFTTNSDGLEIVFKFNRLNPPQEPTLSSETKANVYLIDSSNIQKMVGYIKFKPNDATSFKTSIGYINDNNKDIDYEGSDKIISGGALTPSLYFSNYIPLDENPELSAWVLKTANDGNANIKIEFDTKHVIRNSFDNKTNE